MQTMVEVSEETLMLLGRLSEAVGVPIAELAGKMVETGVKERQTPQAPQEWKGLREGFGMWKDMEEDGVAYQQRMRAEWE